MKVEIRVRNDGERGVFTIKNIKKYEYLCTLPIDIMVKNEEFYNLTGKEVVLNDKYSININLSENIKYLVDFTHELSNDKDYTGYSDPTFSSGIFIGHIINDFSTKEQKNENVLIEDFVEYQLDRFGLKVYAKRDLKKDEELYFNYGELYWKHWKKEKNEKVVLPNKLKFKENNWYNMSKRSKNIKTIVPRHSKRIKI